MSSRKDMPGMLAVSMAGHDRGRLYLVVEERDGFFYIADGKHSLLSSLKKKNRKHLRRIVHLPDEIAEATAGVKEDADVRRLLAAYRKLQQDRAEEKETSRR